MAIQEKFLGRAVNPAGTGVIYNPSNNNITGVVKSIFVCNISNSQQTYSIHFSDSGLSATSSNVIFSDQTIRENETVQIDMYAVAVGTSQYLIANTSSTGLIFSAFGVEITPAT